MNETTKQIEPESPWQAQRRILCGRPANWRLSHDLCEHYAKMHDEAARNGDEESCRRYRKLLTDTRFRDIEWDVADDDGRLWDRIKGGVHVAVLMDIRDALHELKELMERRLPAKRKAKRVKARPAK